MTVSVLPGLGTEYTVEGAREARELWVKIGPERESTAGLMRPPVAQVGEIGANDGEMIAGDGTVAGSQGTLNGLLVIELEGSEFAGDASKMNATLSGEAGNQTPTEIRFNQEVGPLMLGALTEVERFHSLRYDGIPRGAPGHDRFRGKDFDERRSVGCGRLCAPPRVDYQWS